MYKRIFKEPQISLKCSVYHLIFITSDKNRIGTRSTETTG